MRDAIGTMGTILEDSHRSLTRLGLANWRLTTDCNEQQCHTT